MTIKVKISEEAFVNVHIKQKKEILEEDLGCHQTYLVEVFCYIHHLFGNILMTGGKSCYFAFCSKNSITEPSFFIIFDQHLGFVASADWQVNFFASSTYFS